MNFTKNKFLAFLALSLGSFVSPLLPAGGYFEEDARGYSSEQAMALLNAELAPASINPLFLSVLIAPFLNETNNTIGLDEVEYLHAFLRDKMSPDLFGQEERLLGLAYNFLSRSNPPFERPLANATSDEIRAFLPPQVVRGWIYTSPFRLGDREKAVLERYPATCAKGQPIPADARVRGLSFDILVGWDDDSGNSFEPSGGWRVDKIERYDDEGMMGSSLTTVHGLTRKRWFRPLSRGSYAHVGAEERPPLPPRADTPPAAAGGAASSVAEMRLPARAAAQTPRGAGAYLSASQPRLSTPATPRGAGVYSPGEMPPCAPMPQSCRACGIRADLGLGSGRCPKFIFIPGGTGLVKDCTCGRLQEDRVEPASARTSAAGAVTRRGARVPVGVRRGAETAVFRDHYDALRWYDEQTAADQASAAAAPERAAAAAADAQRAADEAAALERAAVAAAEAQRIADAAAEAERAAEEAYCARNPHEAVLGRLARGRVAEQITSARPGRPALRVASTPRPRGGGVVLPPDGAAPAVQQGTVMEVGRRPAQHFLAAASARRTQLRGGSLPRSARQEHIGETEAAYEARLAASVAALASRSEASHQRASARGAAIEAQAVDPVFAALPPDAAEDAARALEHQHPRKARARSVPSRVPQGAAAAPSAAGSLVPAAPVAPSAAAATPGR